MSVRHHGLYALLRSGRASRGGGSGCAVAAGGRQRGGGGPEWGSAAQQGEHLGGQGQHRGPGQRARGGAARHRLQHRSPCVPPSGFHGTVNRIVRFSAEHVLSFILLQTDLCVVAYLLCNV